MAKQYVTEAVASEIIGMSRSWLAKRRRLKLASAVTKFGKSVRYDRELLENFAAKNTRNGGGES